MGTGLADDLVRLLFDVGVGCCQYRYDLARYGYDRSGPAHRARHRAGDRRYQPTPRAERTFLGIATGNTAMRLLGHGSVPPRELRQYIEIVRALLDGQPVDFPFRGKSAEIQFMHRDRHYINLDNRIPIYVAANGPKALRIAGELADGWMTAGGFSEAMVAAELSQVRAAAEGVSRKLGDDYLRCCTISGVRAASR